MARPDFRSQAARRLATERTDYSPTLIDLLTPAEPGSIKDVRRMPIDRVDSNPDQPRQHFDEDALADLAASIREHGVLQPILVRPYAHGRYQIVAGERRWRASKMAGLKEVPVIIEELDEEAALEIAIIENLQREDISPLEEAEMFARMTREHGYSLRKLATKLGKDKGYLENRLRLVDAPDDVRELVAVRSDTLSHAYELMKVEDPSRRRRLARQVAAGELSLVKLRKRIEAYKRRDAEHEEQVAAAPAPEPMADVEWETLNEAADVEIEVEEPQRAEYVAIPIEPEGLAVDDPTIDDAAGHLEQAVAELVEALATDPALSEASSTERQLFAKHLTLARIKLENAIAVVRAGDAHGPSIGIAGQLASRWDTHEAGAARKEPAEPQS